MKIAVDVMSGEQSPDVIIRGAIESLRETKADIILVGDREIINNALSKIVYDKRRIEIFHSTQIISMKESPTIAIKIKKDASVMVAARLVKEGVADGFVSPGNTGATFAAAFTQLGRLKGVSRPAILTTVPNKTGHFTAMLDSGANPECKPIHLVQFAVMGGVYVSKLWKLDNPKITLLSNGEESSKGTEVTRKAYEILKKLDINFKGYAEGRDLFDGKIDVAVCDGFTGNIVLKAIEGVALMFNHFLKGEIRKSIVYKASALLMNNVFKLLKKRMDYAEYGGAPLLGVKGVCIITHGNSSSKEIKNGIKVAVETIKNNVNRLIVEKIKEFDIDKWNWNFWEKPV